ncbi:MAG: hypothetical protein GWN99_17975 [Gemmatimonadetes bacterium]|uniref:Uncharacterized protein n=1 Tax=Candidatus Kutchimonas denitrificans TaxID=3056748 RepID=A0AAE4Z8I3_9BACT|nr:hypothetical protein [Gemmatimonadota bacterium]NIR75623.1 hypothetical protein [Candidatus Kutchimonas denitrificans]NIS02924.1 hypothetical protein [Gemmatimonadota bacterium]NIT68646.1 hypothetical protein [Gemmatimonadota bacterium]NIV25325.1 hypothetical protein [Gemmatimonadota bacterium]
MGWSNEKETRTMRWLMTAALLLACPGLAAAQGDPFDRVREAYPAAAMAEIEAIMARAEAAGVPTEPLTAKALEGAAKGVPADRVVVALSSYAVRLRESAQLVGTGRGTASIVAGADAIRRGVPPEQVSELALEHPEGDLAVPLVVMGDLMEAGVPARNAYRVVTMAMHRQQAPEEMLAIPGAVRMMMRAGQGPGPAADAVGRMIGRGQFRGAGMGPPVPPGSGPPEHANPRNEKGKGKGNPPGGSAG